MSVLTEISDLSEFDPDSGPAIWFVWCDETGEGAGSNAYTSDSAVAEVCRYFDRECSSQYPMRWRYTGGGDILEVLVERTTIYTAVRSTAVRVRRPASA